MMNRNATRSDGCHRANAYRRFGSLIKPGSTGRNARTLGPGSSFWAPAVPAAAGVRFARKRICWPAGTLTPVLGTEAMVEALEVRQALSQREARGRGVRPSGTRPLRPKISPRSSRLRPTDGTEKSTSPVVFVHTAGCKGFPTHYGSARRPPGPSSEDSKSGRTGLSATGGTLPAASDSSFSTHY